MSKLATTKKPPSVTLTHFKCGNCEAHFADKKKADDHCICKCGRLVATERYLGHGTSKDCEKCQTKSNLLSARARLRQVESDLVHAEKNVKRLETEYKLLKAGT